VLHDVSCRLDDGFATPGHDRRVVSERLDDEMRKKQDAGDRSLGNSLTPRSVP
jgi:hypothetical protein